MRQVSLSAGTPGEAVYVGGHKNNPCSEIPSFCRQTSRTTSGLPLWSGLRLENSRSTHSLLIGPADCRNSVYNHSSASHRSNFFLAMTPSILKRSNSNEPLLTGSQRGSAMVLSWRYLPACYTRVGPSPDHYIVTLTTVYSRLKGCNRVSASLPMEAQRSLLIIMSETFTPHIVTNGR